MSADSTILFALLMKNEDVWLNIPSEELFDQLIDMLQLVGIDHESKGTRLMIVGFETKRKRELEAIRLQNEHVARLRELKWLSQQQQAYMPAYIQMDKALQPLPPKVDKQALSDKFRQMFVGKPKD